MFLLQHISDAGSILKEPGLFAASINHWVKVNTAEKTSSTTLVPTTRTTSPSAM